METSRKYWNASSEEFHGQLSTKINSVLYPYIRIYAPYWEELMRFAGLRCKDRLEFPKQCSINQFLNLCHQKMIEIIDSSWEPKRDNVNILKRIDNLFIELSNAINQPNFIILQNRSFINLSLMNSQQEISKILKVMKNLLTNHREKEMVHILSKEFPF